MPPLNHPEKICYRPIPAREAIIAAKADVLVVGAGPAGIGAAIGASEAGAKVILVERYGFVGGNATVALVAPFMTFYTQHRSHQRLGDTSFFPTDHGLGEQVIGGVVDKIVHRLVQAGGAIAPSYETGFVVAFDHEIFKKVALDILDEANVEFLFHAFASQVFKDDQWNVVFETKSGPLLMSAPVVVDCTGDGDIAALAGAEFEIGRTQDRLTQPMTLYFRMTDIDKESFNRYVHENPEQWRGVHGLEELVELARNNGDWNIPRRELLMFATPHSKEVSVNCTRVLQVVGTDVWNLTFAEWQGREQVMEATRFLQKYVPGFRGAYMVQSGIQVGVRETRRIKGLYTLTADDVLRGRKFYDCIAKSSYPIDIHNPHGPGTRLHHIASDKSYDIPLRCLLPEIVDGIVVGGRCISGTHEAHSSYRVMPVAMATGQAAGVCAALASHNNGTTHTISASDVQECLRVQGAIL